MQRNDLLVWMDLEMTSIQDVLVDHITEIAVVLTDKDLNIVAEGPDLVIHVDPAFLDSRMPENMRSVFEQSSLTAQITASTLTTRQAEEQVIEFLKRYVMPQSAPLCGNTIHMDRHFLRIHMKELNDYLFYRCIDVSSIKELAKRWNPPIYDEAERRKGEKPHRAKADIMNSIKELQFYRDTFFKI